LVRVAAIGASAERLSVSRALFMGADGFIDKRADPVAFLEGIRRCALGETVLVGVPKDWLGPIAGAIEQQATLDMSPLTVREREVLSVAAEGLRAKDIAERLGVAERTVTTHLARIYEKLGVNSRLAAVMSASRSGLLRIIPPLDEDRVRVS
jgi:two-component system nitrate/nitrite response regulator NarL